MPAWAEEEFDLLTMFQYDEPIPFTRETWRGRIRACRGIGATLTPEQVRAFDEKHARLLEETAAESFTVLHRIDAHILRPLAATLPAPCSAARDSDARRPVSGRADGRTRKKVSGPAGRFLANTGGFDKVAGQPPSHPSR